MGNTQDAKKRGMAHWLHKQWIATKAGRDQHKIDMERMRKLPVKPKKG